ncbi:MAG: hypothetical protein M0Z70_00380 [Nitrospiraceae bacterium]|nr:hypothetical protein [Nitrospiraceae bacterium]
MTTEELRKAQQALDKWRKDHMDINALRKTYLASIPKQVWASMAFEGEPVDLTILEQYMESLKVRKDKKGK